MPVTDPGSPAFVQTLQRLRHLSQQDRQSRWRCHSGDLPLEAVLTQGAVWPVASLNTRHHVAWARGQQVLWLYQQMTIPEQLQGYALAGLTLRLSLTWWADDAQIFVGGERVRCGDLFDYFTRFCLTEAAVPGTTYTVAIRLVSPGHDDGALVRSHLLYEVPKDSAWPSPEPGFVADELAVLGHYLQSLAPQRMAELEQAAATLDWDSLKAGTAEHRQAFHQSLAALRQRLTELGQWVQQRQVSCVGHAHLDMAWLWPVADTWQAAERTFESVLGLQQDFPELTYTHSSPALFAWLEANRPDLFARVQHQVQSGTWSIDAGLWIEPELNIISGESITRQLLYGQRYCQEKFGHISAIAWLPDTFGFCHQLPQLLRLGGVEVFATQKLRWNDTTQFPYELFEWVGPDGSALLGWTLPPIGTDFDPVQIAEYAARWEARTGLNQALWLPGVGDHGGGPTREMLESARRWAASPLFPQVNFTRPEDFRDGVRETLTRRSGALETQATGEMPKKLPVWTDELYLELHRGCYTTHADQKWFNRRCEEGLYETELWATVAHLVDQQPYPKAPQEQAWKLMLFNQFHDILPGSAIPEVFDDANRDWQQAQTLIQQQREQALQQLESHLALPSPPHPGAQPVLIFNALSWERTAVVSLSASAPKTAALTKRICNSAGQPVPHQVCADRPEQICFSATVPPVGYSVYWRYPQDDHSVNAHQAAATPEQQNPQNTVYRLENAYLLVRVCAQTGDLLSLFDRTYKRDVLSGPANQLQAFADDGQYWDAWNIAPDYENRALPPAKLEQMQWVERGPVRQRLRVKRRLNQSTITQVYCLEADSPLLKVETEVDWQETQVLLKVSFPTAVRADEATYETPFGATVRSTHVPPPGAASTDAPEQLAPSPPDPGTYWHDHAQTIWEVPALRWADLTDSEQDYGLSILTDGKHGFDAKPSQLRLTLLKAPLWPDPNADRGLHRFTYALYPHAGSWQSAGTVQQARSLNLSLTARQVNQDRNDRAVGRSSGATYHSFLRLDNAVLSALKPTETDPSSMILRCYDATGTGATPQLETSLGLIITDTLDLLERPLTDDGSPRPYQIWTYRLSAKAA